MNKLRTTLSNDQLSTLEAYLAGTLRPVTPPMEIVQRLRNRMRFPESRVIVLRLQDWQRMLLVFGGVMSGMLVMITVARTFFYLMRRHM